MDDRADSPSKLSRQQLRAQAREAHDAEEGITVLDVQDPELQGAIRAAIGSRRVTRSALEFAIGINLVGTPRPIHRMRKT